MFKVGDIVQVKNSIELKDGLRLKRGVILELTFGEYRIKMLEGIHEGETFLFDREEVERETWSVS